MSDTTSSTFSWTAVAINTATNTYSTSSIFIQFALSHPCMQALTLNGSPVSGQQIIGVINNTSNQDFFDVLKMDSTRQMKLADWLTTSLVAQGYDASQDIFLDPGYENIYSDFVAQDWINNSAKSVEWLENQVNSCNSNTAQLTTLFENIFIRPLLTEYNIQARNIYYLVPQGGDQTIYTKVITLGA